MTTPRNIARILLSMAATAILGLGLAAALYLGYADFLYHRATPEAVERAAGLLPGKADYQARWARVLARGGDRTASLTALETALACNRWDSDSWIELGLDAEADQDFDTAERYLLEAARVDKQFTPCWTLANFYFRRNDEDNFLRWAKEAAAISYGNLTLLFRLMWRISEDPATILEQAIPDRPRVLVQYLNFLLGSKRFGAAGDVAQQILRNADRDYLPALLSACDRFLGAGQVQAALRIWAPLCAKGLLPYDAPEPERGRSITNGDFHAPLVSRGFGWRVHRTAGVSMIRFGSKLRFTFSGRQPENCQILSQFVPLVPATEYRFRYRAEGIRPNSGLKWRFVDAATGAELASRSPELSKPGPEEHEFLFETPAGGGLARLVLKYERRRGTRRIRGSIILDHVSVEFSNP